MDKYWCEGAGGLFAWEWFMREWKSRALQRLIGFQGARVFYMLLGIVVAVIGVLMV